MAIQTIRGFRDIIDAVLWTKIEHEASILFQHFGFKEIKLPILEKTELFARSIGESTDIVEKEMYTFSDRNGDMLTLRPEATASIVRSYIQNNMYALEPVRKFYTIGPMFRRERPQKGRFRQFYQIDAEVFGISSPYIDIQLILLLNEFFKRLEIPKLSIHINTLGCLKCRADFQKYLLDFLNSIKNKICNNCLNRIDRNPLRALDCKESQCREALADAPLITDFICSECLNHFETVKRTLKKQDIDFIVDKNLVRGLDYYTKTAFEIQTESLGAQSAVAGGGRYDNLVKELGGPDISAIGFAVGLDRLVEIMKDSYIKEVLEHNIDIFIIPLCEETVEKACIWSSALNFAGIVSETDFNGRSLKSLMKKANKLNSRYVLIAGEQELKDDKFILRDMNTKEQIFITSENIVNKLIDILKK